MPYERQGYGCLIGAIGILLFIGIGALGWWVAKGLGWLG